MARARLLKPGFFTNEVLAELPFEGRLLFAGLWTLADREGRLEDRPKRIKAALFSWDEVDVNALLVELEAKGFIDRYMVNGMPLLQVAKFSEHQTPHPRETPSILPGPPEPCKGNASTAPGSPVPIAVSVPVAVPVNSSASSAEPTFLTFPVVGKKDAPEWELHEDQVIEWGVAFPNLDVRAEMRKALVWVKANPGRRKTRHGMLKFLAGWLTRATDGRHGVERRSEDRGSSNRQLPTFDTSCPHSPQCVNPGNWQCHQRTTLEAAKTSRVS